MTVCGPPRPVVVAVGVGSSVQSTFGGHVAVWPTVAVSLIEVVVPVREEVATEVQTRRRSVCQLAAAASEPANVRPATWEQQHPKIRIDSEFAEAKTLPHPGARPGKGGLHYRG